MGHKIAILGASGYTGAELIRLLAGHTGFEIAALGADRKAGLPMAQVYPHLRGLGLPDLQAGGAIDWDPIELVFCALPHVTSQQVIPTLPKHLKIIDLSADFRLRDPAAYETWYGQPHAAIELQKEAVYGLTEFYRADIRAARFVAGTGCNAATGLYSLLPLMTGGVIDIDDIILDMKVGVSGAGRALKENLLHAELSEGWHPYAMGGKHRHLGEFDQELSKAAGREVAVHFTPTLIPANRGILSAAHVKGDAAAIHATLSQRYVEEPFVTVLPLGEAPSTRHIRGSNMVHLGVAQERGGGRATIHAALDNLTKGSSGQAVQNANLMMGLPEGTGLNMVPLFP